MLIGTGPYGQGDTGPALNDNDNFAYKAIGGRIFAITTNGTDYRDLYDFPPIYNYDEQWRLI